MRSSCIPHPPNEPLIVIRQWQREFCNDCTVGAALLSFFEYWHNLKLEMRSNNRRANDIAEAHGDERTQDESLYQFHSERELIEGIQGIGKKDKIRKAIAFLSEQGVLSVHKNPNPRYAFDKTRFFLFHPEALIDWLRNYRSSENRLSKAENRPRSAENRPPSSEHRPRSAENRRTIPETSSETSSKTSSERGRERARGETSTRNDSEMGASQASNSSPTKPTFTVNSSPPSPENVPRSELVRDRNNSKKINDSECNKEQEKTDPHFGRTSALTHQKQRAREESIVDSPFASVEEEDDFYEQFWHFTQATSPKLDPGRVTAICTSCLRRLKTGTAEAQDRYHLNLWRRGQLTGYQNATYDPVQTERDAMQARAAAILAPIKQQQLENRQYA